MSLNLDAVRITAEAARRIATTSPFPPHEEMPLVPLSVREHFDEDMPMLLDELDRLTAENATLRERLGGF
jgi:hypothetical protein